MTLKKEIAKSRESIKIRPNVDGKSPDQKNLEKRLQSRMIEAVRNELPDYADRVFATFQETKNAKDGAKMTGQGLLRGVSDLLMSSIMTRGLIGIEVKLPHSWHCAFHVAEQALWIINQCESGWFCTSVDSFRKIITSHGMHGGIDPNAVFNDCMLIMQSKTGEDFSTYEPKEALRQINRWRHQNGKIPRGVGSYKFELHE